MLVNHDLFSQSDIVSPFLIKDAILKEKALQKLIEGPSFHLKPLDPNGKLHNIMIKINQNQKIEQAHKNPTDFDTSFNYTTIIIPMNSIKSFNFAQSVPPLPELNSTDIANATAIIDQSNGGLIDFISSYNKEELALKNGILRSPLDDLLGVILDLSGKLLGIGGKGNNNNGGGLNITIRIGGSGSSSNNDNDYEDDPTTTRRRVAPTPIPTQAIRKYLLLNIISI